MDVCPLSYQEVASWIRLTRTRVLPEEVEMLMAMDNAFVSECRKDHKAQRAKK